MILSKNLLNKINRRLKRLYPSANLASMVERLRLVAGRYSIEEISQQKKPSWNEHDIILITYADMVQSDSEVPLKCLTRFCEKYLQGCIRNIHLLPFYPWSSDDGFSVIDYRKVKKEYGDWSDVERIRQSFTLMFDLVLNHCSVKSPWFKDFVSGIEPARHYFLEVDPKTDLSAVVRPRTSSLLTPTQTRSGKSHVWTTFSADQVDLNWQNPDLLFEFLDILVLYVSHGARFIRLDAVPYLWKKFETSCIHLPETHEVIKLIRDFLRLVAPEVVVITETNVPHQENISYFGKGDEAQMVYNFTLPPLLLHALINEDSTQLTQWARGLDIPSKGTTYFNFTASHDGIGMRPLQGILTDKEIDKLTLVIRTRNGMVSSRTMSDGSQRPYELNVTYFSALCDPETPEYDYERFLISQTLAMSLQGIPGVYFNSLIAAENNLLGVEKSGQNRTINRMKWDEKELNEILESAENPKATLFFEYLRRLCKRADLPAFHPDAPQRVHQWSRYLFVVERCSIDNNQKLWAIFNLSRKKVKLSPILKKHQLDKISSLWYDALTDRNFKISNNSMSLQPFECLWLVAK